MARPSASGVSAFTSASLSVRCKRDGNVPADVVSAIRSNLPLPNPKSNALVALTKEIVEKRGYVEAQTIKNFLAAGYRKDQILEVLMGVALKTISNYTDHISPNELDEAFRSER